MNTQRTQRKAKRKEMTHFSLCLTARTHKAAQLRTNKQESIKVQKVTCRICSNRDVKANLKIFKDLTPSHWKHDTESLKCNKDMPSLLTGNRVTDARIVQLDVWLSRLRECVVIISLLLSHECVCLCETWGQRLLWTNQMTATADGLRSGSVGPGWVRANSCHPTSLTSNVEM